MTYITCSVPTCPSSSLMNKELKFHQFPYSEERRQEWILACNELHTIHEDWNFFRNKYVCSLHFDRYSYNKKGFLSIFAVPTLYLDKPVPFNQMNLTSAETQTEPVIESTADKAEHCKSITQKENVGLQSTTGTLQCNNVCLNSNNIQCKNSVYNNKIKKTKTDKIKRRKEDVVLQSKGNLESNNSGDLFIQVKKIGNDDFVVSSSPNVKVAVKIGEAEKSIVCGDVNDTSNNIDLNLNNGPRHKKRRIDNDIINIEEDGDSITLSQFLNACDDYLPEHLRDIVKTNARLYTNQVSF
ncbi:uncharacterized protein LOC118276324 [Spodoptera frugiperda]|uniref:Uncharacterized protein LOC118276324 n=1 Tax=Spodoptera frugiperda TaxID=7108 RepID=A0A9R0DEU4_SPOFR|nr:uncharacterized protein LOC118276324 [Spodoptera frugiperda]